MVKRVTIRDVAREAGVSIALVSFVMNRKSHRGDTKAAYRVKSDTEARIIDVARRLDYHPNNAASALRSGRTHTVGVVVSDIANRFFSDIVHYIENAAFEAGYTVLFASTDEKVDKMESMIAVLVRKGIDGLIVAPCAGGDEIVRQTVASGMPVVLLDRDIEGVEASRVMLDNFASTAESVRFLAERGYSHVEMISYDMAISSLAERERGYRATMEALGLAQHTRVHYATYGNARDYVEQTIGEAVGRGVEAMLFPSNTLSLHALQAMNRLGLKTPDDVAIVGFDEHESFELYQPTITRIAQPLQEIGQRSFEMLLDSIDGGDGWQAECYKASPELIVGGSVGDLTIKHKRYE